jgi:hypothetical protein
MASVEEFNDPNFWKEAEKNELELQRLNEQQAKNVNQQKAAVEQQASNQQTSSGGGGGGEKTATCPVCSDKAKGKGKSSGKYIINLNLFFTKVVIRIPKIFDFIPKTVSFDENVRSGEKCGACEGKKQLPDVQQSDAGKYQQVAKQLEAKMPQIMEQEAKLGLGGARTTIIQGNDTLQVGALFNSNSSYRIEKDKGIAISKLQGGKETVLPNGGKCNAVVPVPGSLGWPSAIGNYTIKCGNSFQVEAGGGGIKLSTKGPIELNGGITTIKAPQITLGCEQGPLKIGADSVDITGRFVNISPTEGNFYVRGTVNASGNMVTGGHSHAQSMSFIKAACCGTNQTSTMDQGNKDVSQTQNAVWGGMGYKAITTSLLDLVMFFADIPMDIKNALFRLISPAELTNTVNRMQVLTNMCYPIELEATGLAIGFGVSIVYNYPHTHGLQPMQHTHNTRVPDMDFSADDPQALIQKVLHGGTEGSAPGEAVRDSLLKKVQALMESISSLFSIVKQLPETISSTLRLG